MSDLSQSLSFGYSPSTHTVIGYDFVVSSTVTDPILLAQLEKEVEGENKANLSRWEHEFKHSVIAKYVGVIKEPKNKWKSEFLNEVVAFLAGGILAGPNKLDEAVSISSNEATRLISRFFDEFSDLFDNNINTYRSAINRKSFETTNFISCSYDTDEFFQKALNAMFTYEIGGKAVNLFALMTPADQQAFLKKLNDKCEEEYATWLAGK
ncbi:MAG: hypothetical protein FWG02_09070 [Holophagaceae bacterium]|nr:hypothetical protein [Holophagaceae bacterium]